MAVPKPACYVPPDLGSCTGDRKGIAMRLASSLRHHRQLTSMGPTRIILAFLLAVAPLLHAATQTPENGLEGTSVGDGSPAARDQPQASLVTTASPQIELTSVPAYGSSDLLKGRVTGATAKDHAVAVYIHIPPAGWWTRPTAAAPRTVIAADGTWTCSVTTSDGDRYAIEIVAFLIPLAYAPPVLDAAASLPEALYTYPYAQAIRYPRFKFANCDWMIKRVNDLISPGPNYFTDNPENVWVDDTGQLHLKLTQRGIRWYCGEVIAERTLGCGRCALTISRGIKGMDRNAVLGFFTWDDSAPDRNYREMDIEFSRWGDATLPNARFMVQPWHHTGNMHQFELDPSREPNGVTTHEMLWEPNQVRFRSYAGPFALSPPAPGLFSSWSYQGPDLPAAGKESLHISLWLIGHLPPSDSKPVEVAIRSVTYLPSDPNTVYRFWSPFAGRHFYTISKMEKEKLQRKFEGTWIYEGVAYGALLRKTHTNLVPVYRFWSDKLLDHYYTIDEAVKAKLISQQKDTWTYEGIAFHVWPEGRQPPGTCPVHRFHSTQTGRYFYTATESEKDKLVKEQPKLWTYEGVAWHAYYSSAE